MKKKVVHRDYPQEAVSGLTSCSPLLARVYAARGVKNDSEIDYSLSNLLSYEGLSSIEVAVDMLISAISSSDKIVIVGDYDVDGATSCALLTRALADFGARDVEYVVPNRFASGYGLSVELVDAIVEEKDPKLLITVDNGISCFEAVKKAKTYGIKTIITDHHLPESALPEADAIINPNLIDDQFQSKNLAGVGVVFYLIMALRAGFRGRGIYEKGSDPNIAKYLDLVALGTIADVVPLDRNNRILVANGISRIRSGKASLGIYALLEIGGRNYKYLVSSDLGFTIGPRLNAAGRLQDMSMGVECLLSDDYETAFEIAKKLDKLNQERKTIEFQMKKQAISELENIYSTYNEELNSLCLYDENWHQGVVGILASRIKDRYNRPVVVFAESKQEEDVIQGSIRSVDGVHVRDLLDKINDNSPGLLSKYGGHSMAAGLSIKKVDLSKFKELFETHVGGIIDEEQKIKKVLTDGVLVDGDFSLETAIEIRDGGPWGQEFPEPMFECSFEVHDIKVINDKHLKMVLLPELGETYVEAIAFNCIEEGSDISFSNINAVFYVTANEYRGNIKLQLIIEYYEIRD